jgi:hypothetical protein
MKIYSDMEDLTDPLADQVEEMIKNIELDTPFVAIIPLLKELVKCKRDAYARQIENIKLRLMWALRKLEKEIEEEGGMIVVNKEGNLATKGFSASLTASIQNEVKENFK